MDSRKQKERDFHNRKADVSSQDDSTLSRSALKARFYVVARKSTALLTQWTLSRSQGMGVLDYCCGTGSFVRLLAQHGTATIGIDISEESIMNCRRLSIDQKVDEKSRFITMDAENLGFRNHSFDTIVCRSALHHLDIHRAYAELARVLRKDGEIICLEPLAYNPLIKCYRRMTPHSRTEWEAEHLLTKSSIEASRCYFGRVETRFFGLATLAAVPFCYLPGFNFVLSFLEAVDSIILKVPILKWFAWQVVFVLAQPIPNAFRESQNIAGISSAGRG